MKQIVCSCLCFLLLCSTSAIGQLCRSKNKTSVACRNSYQHIAVGDFHTLEIRNGTLWAWGYNSNGQLGTGNTTDASSPQQVGGDNKWISVAAGANHSLALRSDGTLWTWGHNHSGQLGTGNNTSSSIPQQVGGDNKWVSVAGKGLHSLALKSDGTLWTWGNNAFGQLGTGNTNNAFTPVQVGGDNKWVSVTAGYLHTLALKSDGTLWAWGRNNSGQLGNGNNISSSIPQQVGADNKWVSVVGGGLHSLALKSDGTLWAWGGNQMGQLGTGNTTDASFPQQVGGDNKWISVAPGVYHSLALKSDGTLWTWGDNQVAQLGNGNATNSNVPVQVAGDNKWVNIAGGALYSLALKSDGTLWAWGNNAFGQLRTGNTTNASSPQQVGADNKWISVALGSYYTLALKSNGTLWAWGHNHSGQLGTGNTTNATIPQQVGGDNKWVNVAAGANHSLALKSDGTMWAWGHNGNGRLGTGSTTDASFPQQIGGDNKWISVAAGADHSLALKGDGTLWAWGDNSYGQLGTGSTNNAFTPVQVGGNNKWVSVVGGGLHSLALKSDGTLWAWGRNNNGQLGTGNTNNAFIPQQVGGENRWVSIVGGGLHSLALKSDGTLWAWGDNQAGQLGNGNNTSSSIPQQVGGDSKWVSVAGGELHSLALKSDGTLWAWGDNQVAQLGIGNTNNAFTPQQVGTDVVTMAVGGFHSAFIRSNRSTICLTGLNNYSQLGDGTTTNQSIFTCLSANSIATSFSATSICAGATIIVPYTVSGSYNPDNTFAIQLSNATGSFTSPTVIGSVSNVTSGTVTAIIPAAIPAGTAYRIRVVSSLPAVVSTDNGANITINALPATPAVNFTQPTCSVATGTITVNSPTGAGITYSINNTYQVSNVFSNVAPGNYNVTAKNSSGCVSAAATVVVNAQVANDNQPPTITLKPNPTVFLSTANTYTVQLSDVLQSVTDNCDPNPVATISTLNVNCSNLVTGSNTSPHQAYVSITTTGNQAWEGELGMEFRVNNAAGIVVKQLGTFDHQGNGITGTQNGGIRVAIFNKATQSIVPGLDAIIIGNSDHYTANHRMKDIAPVTLMPGTYVIVSKGYHANELNGNSGYTGSSYAFGDSGNGAISFTGGGLYGDPNPSTFGYPLNADGGPANRYLAGTFFFDLPGSSSGSTNHPAYVSTTTTGNQDWGGELGMEFRVNNAAGIIIKQLGTFDHQGNGITGTQNGGIRVAIFNKATQSIVPGLDAIIVGNSDHYTANHRMKDIAPVTLMPGTYVIVSKGYHANELNGNSGYTGSSYAFGDSGNGAISFTGGGLYGDPNPSTFGYPLNADGGPANRYLAGTFLFDLPGTSGGGTGSYIVNISATDLNGNVAYATATVLVQDNSGVCNPSPAMAAVSASPAEIESAVTIVNEPKDEAKGTPKYVVVYPSPTNGSFHVQLYDFKAATAMIEIFNESGILIEKRQINQLNKPASITTVRFNLMHQHPGVYFIKVASTDGVQTAKVLIQR